MAKKSMTKRVLSASMVVLLAAAQVPSVPVFAAEAKWRSTYNETDGFYVITNPGKGATLSTADLESILTVNGYAFKDLNGNGEVDRYEDWRKTPEQRAENLTDLLTEESPIEKIAPLMLASYHFGMMGSVGPDLDAAASIPGNSSQTLLDMGLRHVLNAASSEATEPQVQWMNEMQKVAEADKDMLGIPVNVFSDPRSNAGATDGLYDGSSSSVAKWPGSLGLAATFDPSITEQFGSMTAREYRALGITTALSPQIDLATEPRWARASGTYGESPELTADIAAAYVKGFQTTGTKGWGLDSVATMLKHWPGDGSGEAGRESHSNAGKYAVYPGDNLADHLFPFTRVLNKRKMSTTEYAASVMPSYSIGIDAAGEPLGGDPSQLGSGVSPYKMKELLFDTYDFGGYVCTDWGVAGNVYDEQPEPSFLNPNPPTESTVVGDGLEIWDGGGGMAWGTGDLPAVERVWSGMKVGVDMYGGLESVKVIIGAYNLALTDRSFGSEAAVNARFYDSARRILLSSFRLGLFDNPYRSVSESLKLVGSAKFNKAGYEAQKASVVMLKNKDNVISSENENKTVYIPMLYTPASASAFGATPASIGLAVDSATASEFFTVVTDTLSETADESNPLPEDIVRRTDFTGVDFALIRVDSPSDASTGDGVAFNPAVRNVPGDVGFAGMFSNQNDYDPEKTIDNGYFPNSLQYRPYTADPATVRQSTLGIDAGEEERWQAAKSEENFPEEFIDADSRSYAGKTQVSSKEGQLDVILETVEAVGDIPVIVAIAASNAMVFSEFEELVDGIVMSFGVSDAAVLEIVSGRYEPSALLPIQMPANMATVEQQLEDVPFDMECHVDSEGNVYDFAFGLNWSGVISDARTEKYGRAITEEAAE